MPINTCALTNQRLRPYTMCSYVATNHIIMCIILVLTLLVSHSFDDCTDGTDGEIGSILLYIKIQQISYVTTYMCIHMYV